MPESRLILNRLACSTPFFNARFYFFYFLFYFIFFCIRISQLRMYVQQ